MLRTKPSRYNPANAKRTLNPGLTRRVLARAAAFGERVSGRKQRQAEKPAHRASGRCAPCVLCSYRVTGQYPATGNRRGERLGISSGGCKPCSLDCLRARPGEQAAASELAPQPKRISHTNGEESAHTYRKQWNVHPSGRGQHCACCKGVAGLLSTVFVVCATPAPPVELPGAFSKKIQGNPKQCWGLAAYRVFHRPHRGYPVQSGG